MKTRALKKWIFTASLAFGVLCSSFVYAVDAAEQAPDKKEVKDYSPYPAPGSGYVTDNARLLTRDQEEKIETWLWQAESKTGIEIAVVTIDSIKDYKGTDNSSIESFAAGLFNKYGIGNLPRNDGVLLLVAVGDRKARIELGEYYGHSRDADANRIMQNVIIPKFKQNDYAGGITNGVKAILGEFAGLRVGFPWELVTIPIAIIVLALIAYSLFKNGKRGWGWVVVGFIFVLVLALINVIVTVFRHMPDTPSSSWSSGGFGGGFGGGSSGGGGATGSW
jgi:uncharacterized protein